MSAAAAVGLDDAMDEERRALRCYVLGVTPDIIEIADDWPNLPFCANSLRSQSSESCAVLYAMGVDETIRSTRRNMLTHTRLLELAMQQAPLLPMRFGTVAPHFGLVEEVVTRHSDAIIQAFEKISGRQEVGVKVQWANQEALSSIVDDAPDLLRWRDKLNVADPHKTHFERIEFGKAAEAFLERRNAELAEEFLRELSALSVDHTVQDTGEPFAVLNAAFLVTRETVSAFTDAVRAIDRRFDQRLVFRVVTPVPPYNFVSLRLDLAGSS